MSNPELLDVQPAARYLGVSASYLNKLRVAGGGPRFAKLGSRVRYRRGDLDAWIESRLVSSTSEAEGRLGGAK